MIHFSSFFVGQSTVHTGENIALNNLFRLFIFHITTHAECPCPPLYILHFAANNKNKTMKKEGERFNIIPWDIVLNENW